MFQVSLIASQLQTGPKVTATATTRFGFFVEGGALDVTKPQLPLGGGGGSLGHLGKPEMCLHHWLNNLVTFCQEP